MDELNKFERVGQTTEGCDSGQHMWDEAEGHSTVEQDGDLTKIKMRCLVCRKQFDFSAPFGLNRFINKQESPDVVVQPKQTMPQIRRDESATEEYIDQSEILKRLLR